MFSVIIYDISLSDMFRGHLRLTFLDHIKIPVKKTLRNLKILKKS